MSATPQDIMMTCPETHVPVKTPETPMTPDQFVNWRASFVGAWWIRCTACAKRHLVFAHECFLQGRQSQV